MRPILLASKSPRRKHLLELAGLEFRIETREVEENYPAEMPAIEVPEFLALKKARALAEARREGEIVLAADTIVELNNTIFGKPKDIVEARSIIETLSGKAHNVITGCALITGEGEHHFRSTTKVYFQELSTTDIDFYIEEYKPYDKAGAYAIQEWIGVRAIDKIEGCYFNVMGLPVSALMRELRVCE